MRKRIKLTIFVLMISLLFVSCGNGGVSEMSTGDIEQGIPANFIPLEQDGGNWENGLHYVFWENVISFIDSDEICIYQRALDDENNDFIFKHKNVYYVNEKKLLELIEIASISAEVRSKEYSLEDEIEIRGAGNKMYSFRITSLEIVEKADSVTHTIKYSATPYAAELEGRVVGFISSVETNEGISFNVDSIDYGIVMVEIPKKSGVLSAIIVKSPEYIGLTYRIVLDEL